MAKAKKKRLPENFQDLLKNANHEDIKAVFLTCDVNARGGAFKRTALAFNELPDDVARWLVEQGADISAVDNHGATPLHSRAGHWQGRIEGLLALGADVQSVDSKGNTPLHHAARVGNVRAAGTLIQHGASVDSVNYQKLTPLAWALSHCSNATIQKTVEISELLLNTQSPQQKGIATFFSRLVPKRKSPDQQGWSDLQTQVRRIGQNFEFHRENYNPDSVESASAALDKLYALFNVQPVPRRAMHDGVSPIIAHSTTWPDQHQELWELLVPSSGSAKSVQGEVIRISGRISRELDGNGGINWDHDFKMMADALLGHLASATSLPDEELQEAMKIISEVKRKYGDTQRLSELAVEWVTLNPKPISLPTPAYQR